MLVGVKFFESKPPESGVIGLGINADGLGVAPHPGQLANEVEDGVSVSINPDPIPRFGNNPALGVDTFTTASGGRSTGWFVGGILFSAGIRIGGANDFSGIETRRPFFLAVRLFRDAKD